MALQEKALLMRLMEEPVLPKLIIAPMMVGPTPPMTAPIRLFTPEAMPRLLTEIVS